MQPSKYQQNILDWLISSDGNAIIDARAGSGKTSTLVMLSSLVSTVGTRAAFLAFNKSIQLELAARLPKHVDAATFHSICFRSLARTIPASRNRDWMDKNKVRTIIDGFEAQDRTVARIRTGTEKLVGLMKANALLPDADESSLQDIIDAHGIEFDESNISSVTEGITLARKVLAVNNEDVTHIDFDDMLYLTAIRNVPLMKYTHLFIDEAQDTNKVQRILMHRMLASNGRLIAVGDENQAIYGFRGADSGAMQAIASEFGCVRFPLSISYRCPSSVVALAQTIVPGIEARENAPAGTVSTLDTWNLAEFNALDGVICRNTAPLITLAFRFIRAHKPVKVLGRDIGQQLISLVTKMRARTLEELANKLDEYATREVAKAMKARKEQQAEQIQDRVDSLIAIIDGMPEDNRTVYGIVKIINDLFTDNGGKATTLATVHKAKGKEWHRVFILDPFLMPSKFARQPWQHQQEQNLRYVAITRSLDTLHMVDGEVIE